MSQEHSTERYITEALSIRELLDMKQAQLDYVLTDLSDEIDMWNLRLAELASHNDPDSLQQLNQLAREACNNLDSQWPFMHDLMHVSGKWHVTKFSTDNVAVKFPMEYEEAFHLVHSNGFSVYEPEDRPPTIGLSFIAGNVPIMSAAIQGNLTVLNYALPQDISLYYARPAESEEAVTMDLEPLYDNIQYYDNLLMLHYESGNSDFYRKSAKQQKKFLLEVVDKISDHLPSPEFGVKAKCSSVTTPYVYRRVEQGPQRMWQRISSSDGEPMMLSGDVEGVSILESPELDGGTPLRGRDQLIDPEAGICMVLRVEECSIPDIFNNQPVYVPMRKAEEIELAVP